MSEDCSNCRNQMTGWDGGFFGLPLTCECRIYGETENRKNCSDFKKKITKSYLLDKIKELEEENEQLRLELETHKNPLWSTREAERKVNKLSGSLADEVKKNGLLNEELNQLRIENERLKSRNNYNLEDCLLEIVELKEEKEQLKKKLESLQKVLHLVECVSDE